jgi:TonB family protein
MTGVDQSQLKTDLSSGLLLLKVSVDPEDLRILWGQVHGPEDASQATGVFVGGALFGTLQEGLTHVRSLRPFSSRLVQAIVSRRASLGDLKERINRLGDEPALKDLQLIGWYCIRPMGKVGLSQDDIEFHRSYFPRLTDIALILRRAEKDGYRAELYARSHAGAFSLEDHRFSSFYLPTGPSVITEPVQLPIQSAIDDNFYLRSYEITRPLKWRDHRKEWESRARTLINPNWLRVLLRKSEFNPRQSISAAIDRAVEAIPVVESRIGSDFANRPTKPSTDATVVVNDIRSAGAANVFHNEQVEDSTFSKFGETSISPRERGLAQEEAQAGKQRPSTAPLFGESKDERKAVTEENASAGPASSIAENPVLSIRETKPILRNKFRLLGVISTWAVVLMLAGMLGLILLQHRTLNLFSGKEEGTNPATTLGFEPVRNGSAWDLHWDVRTPALKSAKNGVLTITDGVHVRKLDFDRSKLDTGRIRYVPEAQDVSFRLQIYTSNNHTLSESVRILTGRSAGLQPANAHGPQLLVSRSAPDRKSVSNLDISRAAKPGDSSNLRLPLVGHSNVPSSSASPNYDHSSPARALHEAKPEARSITSDPAGALAIESAEGKRKQMAGRTGIASNQNSIAQSASENAQKVTPIQGQMSNTPASSMAGNPPMATKLIPRSPATTLSGQPTEGSYVGPQPLRKSIPNLASLGATISSVREVQVEVYIDASGRVTNTRLANADSDPNSILDSASISAARQWIFEPARSHGRAINSVYKVLFRFIPSPPNAPQ